MGALSTILSIDNAELAYGLHPLLDRASLTVAQGERIGLIGRNGTGKSSLLRVIAGLETADSGQVLFHGEDATDQHVRERQVGFVFQHYALFRNMTIFENVAFGLRVRPKKFRPAEAEIRDRVMKLLHLVQLDWLADRYPHQLSGGQRQRIALARALAVEPKVLLLDEPCSALDPIATQKIEELLYELKAELTIVIVTHNLQQATQAFCP